MTRELSTEEDQAVHQKILQAIKKHGGTLSSEEMEYNKALVRFTLMGVEHLEITHPLHKIIAIAEGRTMVQRICQHYNINPMTMKKDAEAIADAIEDIFPILDSIFDHEEEENNSIKEKEENNSIKEKE